MPFPVDDLGSGVRPLRPTREREPGEPSIRELFQQLSEDASHLIRQEIALGRAEVRETGRAIARDVARLAVAAMLGALGGLALTLFLIIVLAMLFNSLWISALVVGIGLGVASALFARSALQDLKKRELKPNETMDSVRTDVRELRSEADAIRHRRSS